MTALCELQGVSVRYGAHYANRDISLRVDEGEVVALCGENGAGKSTLLGALYGLAPLCAGTVRYGGAAVTPTPQRAIAAGVGLVHQHFVLLPSLTVAENVVFGWEPRRGPLFERAAAEAQVAALSARYGLAVDPRRRLGDLSVGERQRVEILKILHRGARLLVLDEPTAVLTPAEATHLLTVLRALCHDPPPGEPRRALLLVTHKLDEVIAVADRVAVLRRGQLVAHFATSGDDTAPINEAAIARAMVGRDTAPVTRAGGPSPDARDTAAPAEPGLEVTDLSVTRDGVPRLSDITLRVAPGEILGVAGVEGNGQSELCEAIAGLLPAAQIRGDIRVAGRPLTGASVAERRAAGLGLVLEDRQRQGLIPDLTLEDNLLLGPLRRFRRGPLGLVLDRRALRAEAERLLRDYQVSPPEPTRLARELSGGNQQKVVLARELGLGAARALCIAQPTRGVDIGAIEAIHQRLLLARARGAAILLVSSELDELRTLCDRIAVLHRGRLVATLDNPHGHPLPRERLGALMLGAA